MKLQNYVKLCGYVKLWNYKNIEIRWNYRNKLYYGIIL